MNEDTIYALASGRGRAGVAVVRLSGPAAGNALGGLMGRPLPPPRRAVLARLRHPRTGEDLDRALALWFPAPASFTGEDVAELHLHGGRAVVAAVLDALATLPGLRPAEAGEFSRRAFANGRMDLTAAEGLADLIAAETESQRRQALRQMDGALQRLYDAWREDLIRLMALAEAEIDFSDEDLPAGLEDRRERDLAALIARIEEHLDDRGRGERLRDGLHVAIMGPPNAGKSSLLNALSRRQAAIVSDQAGTTRDVIEVHLDLAGYPVTIADTAGLRDVPEGVEAEGVRRALERAEKADLRLAVFDGACWPDADARTRALLGPSAIAVLNKVDLWSGDAAPPSHLGAHPLVSVSARTGAGVDELESRLARVAAEHLDSGEAPVLTQARHRAALEQALEALKRARTAALPDLAAEDMRLAARAIGRITGRVDVEDVLDVIFGQFCIGK